MIAHAELVEDFFGYWPEFADAKLVRFGWVQPGTIELALHYIDDGLGKDAVVNLRFSGVSSVRLTDLLSENVIDCLSISPGTPVAVDLEACYGLAGTFQCLAVEVSGLVPNNSSKPTPLCGAA
jgi:hypothetical protein